MIRVLALSILFAMSAPILSAGLVNVVINSNDGWEQSLDQATWEPAVTDGNFFVQNNGVFSPVLWPSGVEESTEVYYRLSFLITGTAAGGTLWVSVDDDATLSLNGTEVFRDDNGFAGSSGPVDLSALLVAGVNTIEGFAFSTICCGRGFAPYIVLTYDNNSTVIPEPGTLAAGALGIVAIALLRSR